MKYLLAAETAPTEELTLWEEVVASLKTFFLDNWLNVVYFFVALLYLLLILILAQIIGIPITGLVALISAAGLAVSLALQDSLSNLANGIIIISTKPFHEGDYVQINGVEGTVKNIRMLTTALVTPDNKLIVLPNSNIVTNEIVNYNVLGRRRVDLTFSVGTPCPEYNSKYPSSPPRRTSSGRKYRWQRPPCSTDGRWERGLRASCRPSGSPPK